MKKIVCISIIIFIFSLFFISIKYTKSIFHEVVKEFKQPTILIKSTGPVFKLEDNDEIKIYAKKILSSKVNLKISNIKEENTEICYSTSFTDNLNEFSSSIFIKDLISNNCFGKNLFFEGEINFDNNEVLDNYLEKYKSESVSSIKKIITKILYKFVNEIRNIPDTYSYKFYFNINQEIPQINDNLLVVPTTVFYNYYSNLIVINNYFNKQNKEKNYISLPNDVPITTSEVNHNAQSIIKSVRNLKKIFKKFDIIYDYDLEKGKMVNYKNIIFPYYQEYISDEMLNDIEFVLNDTNKFNNFISIGGANFWRKVEFIKENNNLKYIKFYHNKFSDFQKYNLNIFDPEIYKSCNLTENNFSTDKEKTDIDFAHVSKPGPYKDQINKFYEIKCDNLLIPLISVNKFSNGQIIHFNSDYAGLNFPKHKNLNNFFLGLFNN